MTTDELIAELSDAYECDDAVSAYIAKHPVATLKGLPHEIVNALRMWTIATVNLGETIARYTSNDNNG